MAREQSLAPARLELRRKGSPGQMPETKIMAGVEAVLALLGLLLVAELPETAEQGSLPLLPAPLWGGPVAVVQVSEAALRVLVEAQRMAAGPEQLRERALMERSTLVAAQAED